MPAQLVLAWVLAQGNDIIPIPGTKKRIYLKENVKAINLTLTATELLAIEQMITEYAVIEERYRQEAIKMANN